MTRVELETRRTIEPGTVLDLPRALDEVILDPEIRERLDKTKRFLPWFNWAASSTTL